MSDFSVRVENVGKKFDIGIERQKTVRQHLVYWIRGRQPTRGFWAVKDISFDIKHGEGFGIIGPNGAGKSTLMRLLAGIYQPNEGRIGTEGRVNPFLALGVSMLPQLTVMENLRLCAALQGYSGQEFRRKLDGIIEFSELHDYLYAVVADLSAGWAARVAFSIAIHTDLNILLVDESLVVGDDYFRAKCRKRFEQLKGEGRTIVLVSHSMSEVLYMCNRALYLDGGVPVKIGDAKSVVEVYEKDLQLRVKRI